jgi:PAS domain S-box-containing protein
MTLRSKLIWGGIMLVLIPVAFVSLFSVTKATSSLDSAAREKFASVAKSLAEMTDVTLSEELKIVRGLSTTPLVVELASVVAKNGVSRSESEMTQLTRELSKFKQQSGDDYESIVISGTDGVVYADGVNGAHKGVIITDREYFNTAMQGKLNIGTVVKSKTTGHPVVPICSPIFSNTGEIVGALALILRPDFFNHISNTKIGATGYGILVDQNGIFIAHPDKSLILETDMKTIRGMEALAYKALEHGAGVETYEYAGMENIGGYAPVQLTGWSVIASGTIREQFAPVCTLRDNLIIFGAVFLSAAIVLVLIFARMLTKPIKHLVTTAHRFGIGEMGTRTGLPHSADELGQLAKSFDDMASLLEKRSIESRNAETALRENEEKYRTLIETTDTGYVIVDRGGTVLDANAEYARLSGHTAVQEIIGRPTVEWTASYDLERHARAAKECGKKGYIRNLEIDYANGNGGIVPIEINASLIQTVNGMVTLSLCRDITERKQAEAELQDAYEGLEAIVAERTAELGTTNVQLRAEIEERKKMEEALRESRRKFKEVADLLPQSVFETDVYGAFTFLNQAAYATFEFTRDDFEAGLSFSDFIAPEEREKIGKYQSRIFSGEKINFIEITALKKGGTKFPAALYPSVIYSSGTATGVRGILVDLSDRKKMEAELRRAEKLESIGQLAAGIAHEINTPAQYAGDNTRFLEEAFGDLERIMELYNKLLTALRAGEPFEELTGKIEATMEDIDLQYIREEIPKAVRQSMDGIERISTIVKAMKEFSHPGTDEKKNIDLNRAIENTITVARNEWKYVADVITHLDPDLPFVPCLPGEINQVVLNMIVNAAHAIAEKQTEGSQQKGTITISTRVEEESVEIRICDTGDGIPENIRSRIFDPFFTTKEVGKGTGQGLAISHSVIVDKHGGTIRFDSAIGNGTTFFVRLPLETAH